MFNLLANKEKEYFLEIKNNPKEMGRFLCKDYLTTNYQYVLGTMLAFDALKYANLENIVFLNNHIHEYEGQSISSVCEHLGIDINDTHFLENVILSIEDYINQIKIITDKSILARKKDC